MKGFSHNFIPLIHPKAKWNPNNPLAMSIGQNSFYEPYLLEKEVKWQVRHKRSTSCQFVHEDIISFE